MFYVYYFYFKLVFQTLYKNVILMFRFFPFPIQNRPWHECGKITATYAPPPLFKNSAEILLHCFDEKQLIFVSNVVYLPNIHYLLMYFSQLSV